MKVLITDYEVRSKISSDLITVPKSIIMKKGFTKDELLEALEHEITYDYNDYVLVELIDVEYEIEEDKYRIILFGKTNDKLYDKDTANMLITKYIKMFGQENVKWVVEYEIS